MKVLFFDVGYTLVNEDAVWEARCREQAQTDEAKKLGLSAVDIYHEIEIASISRKPLFYRKKGSFHVIILSCN